jgi:hypothetical protein
MPTSEHGTLLLFLVFVLSYYVCTVYTHNRTTRTLKRGATRGVRIDPTKKPGVNAGAREEFIEYLIIYTSILPINYKELILSIIKLTHIIQ